MLSCFPVQGGGYIGKCDIPFDELESMEVQEAPSRMPSTSQRRTYQSENIPDSRRVVTFSNESGGRLNSIPDFSDTESAGGQLNTEDDCGHSFSYHLKQDVRDKNGRLKGIIDLEVRASER